MARRRLFRGYRSRMRSYMKRRRFRRSGSGSPVRAYTRFVTGKRKMRFGILGVLIIAVLGAISAPYVKPWINKIKGN